MINSFETPTSPADAWDLLAPQISASRRARMERVASHRTDYLRLVLQDVHDPHNVGACLRSAEAFGIQNVDLINIYQKFGKPSSVARGARYWLDLHKFNDIDLYCEQLRAHGYRLAAAYPGSKETSELSQVPIDRPLAIVFGNERAGLDPKWQPHIDYRFTIPMYGMVESFNISVSVAISLFALQERSRREIDDERYLLKAPSRQDLLNRWACQQSQDPKRELERLRASSPHNPE